LKCIYTNADSFLNTFEEFKQRYVSESETPDTIAITEVLPKNMRYTVNKADLDIEGYELFPGEFPIGAKRGIIIYVKKSLIAVEVKIDTNFNESAWIKVNIIGNDKLLFGCIYRSPSSDEENVKALNELLTKVSDLKCSHMITTGHYNFPDIDWCTWNTRNESSNDFLECIRDNFLNQVINQPTRHRHCQESSLLDLLLVNDNNNVVNVEYLDPLGSSDHIVIRFEYRCYFEYEKHNFEHLNYYKGDYESMRKELDIYWDSEQKDNNTVSMLNIFMDKFNSAIDKHVPKSKNRNIKGNTPLSKEAVLSIKRNIECGKDTWKTVAKKNIGNIVKQGTKLKD
jgi:hypothetical protein